MRIQNLVKRQMTTRSALWPLDAAGSGAIQSIEMALKALLGIGNG
jgi:hypothetical protein